MNPIVRPLLALVVALPSTGCVPPETSPERVEAPATGEIPIDLLGPQGAAVAVPVHVNGQGPYAFVFDTGATLTCVDEILARDLALPDHRIGEGVGVGVGGAGRVRVVHADSVRVGEVTAVNLPVCVLDLEHVRRFGPDVHGLIGLNFMRPFTVILDFEREILRLEQ